MNIQHLRYAVEVERTGSISQAAENLYMGQPNLSKAIKELEQTLNIKIFDRTSRGARVTPKGREFLRYAKSILAQYEEMEALGRQSAGPAQVLRLSVPRASYIASAFTAFVATLSLDEALEVDFRETNSLRAVNQVASGASQLGVIRYCVDYEAYFKSLLAEHGLEHHPVWDFEYQLLMSAAHPLAQNEVVPFAALAGYVEVLHGDVGIPRPEGGGQLAEELSTEGDKRIYVYERGSQFDLLARVPATYMWVSPMPRDLLQRNGLVQRPCSQSGRYRDVLVWPKGHQPGKQEAAFIRLLRQEAAALCPPGG